MPKAPSRRRPSRWPHRLRYARPSQPRDQAGMKFRVIARKTTGDWRQMAPSRRRPRSPYCPTRPGRRPATRSRRTARSLLLGRIDAPDAVESTDQVVRFGSCENHRGVEAPSGAGDRRGWAGKCGGPGRGDGRRRAPSRRRPSRSAHRFPGAPGPPRCSGEAPGHHAEGRRRLRPPAGTGALASPGPRD